MSPTRWILGAALAATVSACVPAPVPVNLRPVGDAVANPEAVLGPLSQQSIGPAREGAALPGKRVTMPRAGQTNAFGQPVSAALERAYDAYLAGNGQAALDALAGEPVASLSVKERWHRSAFRSQVLIMMGRAADAEEELDQTQSLERRGFASDVFTRSLRGEARVWIGEYDRAVEMLAPVAVALDTWRLPTSYSAPPSNIDELVYVTTAQLRTYTSLAGLYLLQERIAEALAWAERAEILYAEVHYVAAHFLYGQYLKVYADSYYGRALNLTFLAAARAVAQRNPAAGASRFALADAFYEALGYAAGKATTQTLRAWAALRAGQPEQADAAAARAVEMAIAARLPDLVWRVQALRGEALLADGRTAEAEAAFRSADAAVDAVSGALSSDRAKRRFGVGKEELTYRLAQFDVARGDIGRLFADLERGRARAFVDMLSDRPVALGRGGEEAPRIRAIDSEVRQRRLVVASASAPADDPAMAGLLRERTALVDRLGTRDPDLADVYRANVVPLARVQSALPADALMIYGLPARGDDPLRLLLIRRGAAGVLETDTPRSALRAALERLKEGVERGSGAMQAEAVRAVSAAVGIDKWPRAESIYVVPSGDLFFIPWGAVVEGAAVAVLPTGSWILRERGARREETAVVVGDPAFGGLMPQLRGARVEAARVAAIYRVRPLLAANATEAAVRAAVASGSNVLHVATHGTFDADHPLRSAIYLTGRDGKAAALTAAQLFEKPLQARLVVLSACETGVGRVVAGDDFLGLVRSFYLGGSSTVVNSLWPVEDEGTRLFMETFHANLRGGRYGAAWTAARDATKAAGHPVSVYAAFVLGGSLHQ